MRIGTDYSSPPLIALSRARLTFSVVFQGSERYLVLIFVMAPSIRFKANCCLSVLSSGEDVMTFATRLLLTLLRGL